MLKTGMIVDNRYKVLHELGRGGTSCVFLVENVRLHSFWAIKEVFKNGFGGDMLIAESGILTRLRHPGLPTIIDIIETPESYLIVMEYIEGVSLDKVLASRGRCTQEEVIRWGKQLCDVLEYLHTRQPVIIYRDMKPANIMLKPDGNVVLIDFGLARQYKQHKEHDTIALGTHGYAAPEQYDMSRQSDARSDIYSLGVTLYHLVTGQDPTIPPYATESIRSYDPGLDAALDETIHHSIRIDPDQRFSSAAEMKMALDSIGGNVYSSEYTPQPRKSSKAWIWIVVAVAIVITVTATIFAFAFLSEKKDTGASSEPYIEYEDEMVYITEEYGFESFYLTPDVSGYYNIYSTSDDNCPCIDVYDEYYDPVDPYSGDSMGFDAVYYLEAGVEYELCVYLISFDGMFESTGSFMLSVDYLE